MAGRVPRLYSSMYSIGKRAFCENDSVALVTLYAALILTLTAYTQLSLNECVSPDISVGILLEVQQFNVFISEFRSDLVYSFETQGLINTIFI